MATSGSVDYSTSRDTLIEDALLDAGIIEENEEASATTIAHAARKLNSIVKQWMGTADFAPGLKVWSRSRATVFLQKDQGSYSLGPTGDHATASYVRTTLTAAAAASANSLTVSSITDISASDYIGIELDDGTLHWDTVNGAPSGSTVAITTGLASAAASGRYVYAYTTKISRPLEILYASLRDSDLNDTPLGEMSLNGYEAIGSKTADGTPTAVLYEFGLTNGTLYTDVQPDDVTSQIRLVYLRPIEDFDASTDEPDYPQGWYRPLQAQLTIDLCIAYNRPVSAELKNQRDEALAMAQSQFAETTDIYFQPGVE